MKNNLFGSLMLGLALLATSGQSNADLVMTITDAGSGNSRFVFNGSTTVLTGPNGTQSSFWVGKNSFSTPFLTGSSSYNGRIVSGAGSLAWSRSGGGETLPVFIVYAYPNVETFGFAPAVSPPDIQRPAGTVWSWSGDLIAAIPFSVFNVGVYTTRTLGPSSGTVMTIDSDYILTIVPAGTVPEPGTVALIGLGLAGLGYSRRKQ